MSASDAQMMLDLEASGREIGQAFEKDGKRKSFEKDPMPIDTDLGIGTITTLSSPSDAVPPTNEEMKAFVESPVQYLGVFANFLQRPLPESGNGWGAPPKGTDCTPLLGGYLADAKIGRYRACWYGVIIGFFSHILLVIAAIPNVMTGGYAIVPFILGIISLGFASGFIKPTIAPMIADQSTVKKATVITLMTGERVIADPNATVERMLLLYYWASNIGDFFSIATTLTEKHVGFWLAYLLPGIVYMLMPVCLLWAKPRITLYPPGVSSVADGIKVVRLVHRQAKHLSTTDAHWEAAKPTNLEISGQYDAIASKHNPGWISWDDEFVDELRTTLKAFWVFAFLPLWYMADGDTNTILTNMAGSMTTNGLPNDLLSNFNPISTVVAIPIYNWVLYPGLRKRGFNFSLIQRMSCGYFIGAILNAIATVIKWQIYKTSPCRYQASDCQIGTGVSPLSAWLTIIPFWLQPLGGIMISVSSYEIAYTMTPPRMKGSVIDVVFFTYAISQAIIEIASPAFKDPHLVWPFVAIGIANLLASFFNWYLFRHIDHRENTDLNCMGVATIGAAKMEASGA